MLFALIGQSKSIDGVANIEKKVRLIKRKYYHWEKKRVLKREVLALSFYWLRNDGDVNIEKKVRLIKRKCYLGDVGVEVHLLSGGLLPVIAPASVGERGSLVEKYRRGLNRIPARTMYIHIRLS